MLRRLALIAGFVLGLLGLAGCSTHPAPRPADYVPVERPRAVSCVPRELAPAPANLETKESLAAVPEGPQRYTRLAADWAARLARMLETEAVVKRCREAAPPP